MDVGSEAHGRTCAHYHIPVLGARLFSIQPLAPWPSKLHGRRQRRMGQQFTSRAQIQLEEDLDFTEHSQLYTPRPMSVLRLRYRSVPIRATSEP